MSFHYRVAKRFFRPFNAINTVNAPELTGRSRQAVEVSPLD
jgi:hypothetical protein